MSVETGKFAVSAFEVTIDHCNKKTLESIQRLCDSMSIDEDLRFKYWRIYEEVFDRLLKLNDCYMFPFIDVEEEVIMFGALKGEELLVLPFECLGEEAEDYKKWCEYIPIGLEYDSYLGSCLTSLS